MLRTTEPYSQQEAVSRYVAHHGTLLAEYVEVESGKRHKNRPQLQAALEHCKKARATLVIAKLDRLSRNVALISKLLVSDVQFVCCDNPHATKTMLHMLAVFAEHEREQISERTKAALARAKARGTRLGNPRYLESIARAYSPRPCSHSTGVIADGPSRRAGAGVILDVVYNHLGPD
jgi:DNA invertase Pin-like site-specific DNA recombinase